MKPPKRIKDSLVVLGFLVLASFAVLGVNAAVQSHPVSELVINEDLDLGDQYSIIGAENVQTNTINGKEVSSLGGKSKPYGDGSDGEIIRSTDGDENGFLLPTTYKIKSGVTRNVSEGVLIIHATKKIVINGKLTAKGTGEDLSEGLFGVYDGQDGAIAGGGDGGDAGDCSDCRYRGSGNGGAQKFSKDQIKLLRLFRSRSYDSIYDFSMDAGAKGGYGADSCNTAGYACRGQGEGGNGGGAIVLVAPEIDIKGNVVSEGRDGTKGENGNCLPKPGSGGGGGGAGGLVILKSPDVSGASKISVAGGSGGKGGDTPSCIDADGEDGEDGSAGEIFILN